MPRRTAIVFFLILLVVFPAFASHKEKKKEQASLYKVGVTFRDFSAPADYNWRGSNDRAITGMIWYPAEAAAEEKDVYVPDDAPLFYEGRAAKDAALAPSFESFPLIALSHGTGGSAGQMAWLGMQLAARGYIVVAVNHPGNNGVTGYRPEGFVEWWWRARDISLAIDGMLTDRRFGSHIDPDRIGAAGFSLGGYTMMLLAGATTNFKGILDWCELPDHHDACNPPEMPDLIDRFKAIEQRPDVRDAIAHSGESYRDARIRAVFAIAPAVARGVNLESLGKISIPVDIVVGNADPIAPAPDNAEVYAHNIPGAQITVLPGNVAHYTFLDVGTDIAKKKMPVFFTDPPGVDREAVHKQVGEMAADFFDQQLAPQKKKKSKK